MLSEKFKFISPAVDEGELIGQLAIELASIRGDMDVMFEWLAQIAVKVGIDEQYIRDGTVQMRQELAKDRIADLEGRIARLPPAA